MSASKCKREKNIHEQIPLSKENIFTANQSKVVLKLSQELSTTSSNGEERENWSNRFEFLLACVGYSVGLGNVWRFGYLCSKSGGGAFLIPYFVTLILVALPLMYLEFGVGQFTQRGPLGAIGRLCPFFKGTGIATVVISYLLTTYYIVIIAWDLYFLFSSFAYEVPWKYCNNPWNTDKCWDGSLNDSMKLTNDSRSPSEEFFRIKLLNESDSMENFGYPKPDLIALVILAWVIVYFCIWKGVKSTGKVVYVTALFPYAVLIIILIRGITLDGASIGLKYFWIPQWDALLNPMVWVNAAIQNFNSIGVAFGGLISMSSYNKQNKKILSNVLAIGCVDAFTSLVCGSTVFSVLGYMAKSQSKTIENVVQQGPGLVFMVLPEAIRNMGLSPLWAILFFSMIFLLGIDSQFTMVETVVTTIEDEFGIYMKKIFRKREVLVLIISVVTFFLAIPNLCPGGIFYFTILDFFSAGISVFYIGFFEVMAIAWIYGANRLAKNIKLMNNQKPNIFFVSCWYFISPLFILVIWTLSWYQYEPISYGSYKFSTGAQAFGWCIALISIISIPLGAIHTVVNTPGKNLSQKISNSFKPTILDLDEKPNEYLSKPVNNRAHNFKMMDNKDLSASTVPF